MELSHASALALVGWYLIVPPYTATGVDYNAPASSWQAVDHVDTEGDCQRNKAETVDRMSEFLRAQKVTIKAKLDALRAGECVAADDPLIKTLSK